MANQTVVSLLIKARDDASAVFQRVKLGAAGLAAGLLGLFGAGKLAGLFGDAISSAASFEAAMDAVQARLGYTNAQVAETGSEAAQAMAALTAQAQAMGASTAYTATQAAQGLEILAMAGLTAQESIEALPVVLAVAKGAGISLADAAAILTGAVGAMGDIFSETTRYADVFAKAATLANHEVGDLGQAFKVAGGSATASNLTLEQTAALVTALAKASLQGSEGGTALRNILNELRDPASRARQALAGLGDTSGDLYRALETITAGGARGQAAIGAFTVEAQSGIRALLSVGVPGLQQWTGALERSNGAAVAAAETMGSNLDGALASLGSAWDALRQSLVAPLLGPLADQIKTVTDRLSELNSSGRLTGFAAALKEAVGTAGAAVVAFIDRFDFAAATQSASDFVSRVSSGFGTVVTVVATAADALKIFVNGFAGGVKLIGAGVTGVTSVAYGLVASTLELLDTVGLIPDRLRTSIRGTADLLGEMSGAFLDGFRDNASAVTDALDSIGERFRDATDQQIQDADRAGQAADEAADRQVQAHGKVSGALEKVGEVSGQVRDQVVQDAAALAGATGQMGDRITTALANLKVESQSSLETVAQNQLRFFQDLRASGQATTEELKRAFREVANAQITAYQDSEPTTRARIDAMLREQAAALGLTEEYETLGAALQVKVTDGYIAAETAATDLSVAADGAAKSAERMAHSSRESSQAAADEWGTASQRLEQLNNELDANRHLAGDLYSDVLSGIKALGDRAYNAFIGISNGTEMASEAAAGYQTEIARLTDMIKQNELHAFGMLDGFRDWVAKVNDVQLRWNQQALAAENLRVKLVRALEEGTIQTYELEAAARAAESSFSLLDDQQLQGLRSAIEAARREVERLRDDVQDALTAAQEELEDLEVQGDRRAELDLDYRRRRAEAEERLREAQRLGDAQAIADAYKLLEILEKQYKIRLEQLKAEEEGRERRSPSTIPAGAAPAPTPGAPWRGTQGGQDSRLPGEVIVVPLPLTPQQTAEMLFSDEAVRRYLVPRLDEIARRKK